MIAGRCAPGLLGLAAVAALGGCQPYRIEHRTRPAFYHSASETPLPDQIELDDGTVIVYTDQKPRGFGTPDPDAPPFTIRDEDDAGRVTLRCMLPEHVIANTMTCLRNEEYELMWEQLLARRTRSAYEAEGAGFEEFKEFMDSERPDLMQTLNRMSFGFFGQDVVLEPAGDGVVRARFSPRLSEQFRFRTVEMVMEDGGMKLVMIR